MSKEHYTDIYKWMKKHFKKGSFSDDQKFKYLYYYLWNFEKKQFRNDAVIDLLVKMLRENPEDRISVR